MIPRRNLLGLLTALALAASAQAQVPTEGICKPAPLGERALYLRGSMNGWAAMDEQQFRYACDHYELVTRLNGEQSFKIGDEDWSADADFGGTPKAMQLKGPAIERRFDGGIYCLNFSPDSLTLTMASCPASTPMTAAAAVPVLGDPVARSLRFDSRAMADKSPFGAVPAGTSVEFNLRALPGVSRAVLVLETRRLEGNQELLEYTPVARLDMQPQTEDGGQRWSARYRFGQPAVYGYYFVVTIGGQRYVYENNRDPVYWTREKGSMGLGTAEALPDSARHIRRYRQTVYAADFKVPEWARDAVYYYIFPERYRNGDKSNDPRPGVDRYHERTVELHQHWLEKPFVPGSGDGSDDIYNNDFFGGDLAGIIEKLDDIKDLGANTIYMTPIWQAASNHKYDTADYKKIDPHFGSEADFVRLCAEAAKRGIRVIPDASLNHVGSDSVYFDRYGNYKSNGAFEGGKPNPASPWADWFTLDAKQSEPDKQYKGWVGVADLPEINKASTSFRAFAYGDPDSVMKHWLDRGAAGWRMDVAPWVPDDFWREWRTAVKTHKPDALTVAETWFDASKFFLGDEFDSTMNYIFRSTVLDYAAGGDAAKLYANIELMREAYPPQAFYALMNLLSTHDTARSLWVLGYHEDGDAARLALAKRRLLLAMQFQMSFPGSPAIYYGDEVGVGGGEDPLNRATYPWPDEGGKPDLQLRAEVKRLLQLREAYPVLRHGSIAAPIYLDAHVIALLRQDGDHFALTLSNNADVARSLTLKLPVALQGAEWRDVLGDATADGTGAPHLKTQADGTLTLTVPAFFGRILLWKQDSK